jgi:hypothetical protein
VLLPPPGLTPPRPAGALLHPPDGGEPTVRVRAGAGPKAGKLRCPMDPGTADPEADVARLLALGATRADVGPRGDEGCDVLADPEGNEFCVLHRPAPRAPGDVS